MTTTKIWLNGFIHKNLFGNLYIYACIFLFELMVNSLAFLLLLLLCLLLNSYLLLLISYSIFIVSNLFWIWLHCNCKHRNNIDWCSGFFSHRYFRMNRWKERVEWLICFWWWKESECFMIFCFFNQFFKRCNQWMVLRFS